MDFRVPPGTNIVPKPELLVKAENFTLMAGI
jgi:hypothetical protein